jgi:hypothetical protein
MSKKVNLGGDRLGSGAKMDVTLHGYERSTHDLSYIWRSSMAPGTLVPFMKILALPGDTFDIKLNADVKTLPTVGPLFGSFKLQMDIFSVPIRLYNAGLHMNRLNIGLDMSKVKFPVMNIVADKLDSIRVKDLPLENKQINQSSLLAYLGIRGVGMRTDTTEKTVMRKFNAIPLLAYWDIYKNYYANKQEEIGAYLTKVDQYYINNIYFDGTTYAPNNFGEKTLLTTSNIAVNVVGAQADDILCKIDGSVMKLKDVFYNWEYNNYDQTGEQWAVDFTVLRSAFAGKKISDIKLESDSYLSTSVSTFSLSNIDEMRDRIMKHSFNSALTLNNTETLSPYKSIVSYVYTEDNSTKNPNLWALNGLGLKTYQSDIFNNWLNTESIDGENGISAVTAISTAGDKFTIDTLNLSKKVYDMLNRVAVSGGSYEDWLSATYAHEPRRRAESPIYLGGLSKEVVFQEVISQSNVEYDDRNNPLGSLAGRGVLNSKHKGGYIVAKFDEPCYLIGIISLTPRVDYSQGNDWDMKLYNMNDLHKPALDEIGFQDLVTDQMAFWESHGSSTNPVYYSAGKQPAWLNYMTNYNKTYGTFADSKDQMFMTLNRRYEMRGDYRIKDLTTYIDPQKFNYIFADTRRDAQNFWVQVSNDITARRKMSAKLMPNL